MPSEELLSDDRVSEFPKMDSKSGHGFNQICHLGLPTDYQLKKKTFGQQGPEPKARAAIDEMLLSCNISAHLLQTKNKPHERRL